HNLLFNLISFLGLSSSSLSRAQAFSIFFCSSSQACPQKNLWQHKEKGLYFQVQSHDYASLNLHGVPHTFLQILHLATII
ncbi:hypothetical protein L1Z99_24415, partial [Escherichia coli]|uniref:hypothetical protein n=1 Tax=Escherichia coli TaxID=562 RepID=UPI001F32F915